MARDIKILIEAHRNYYEAHEKFAFDRARALYRGKHFTTSANQENRFLCSENMVFSVAESAISAMLGPNPRVAARAVTQESEDVAASVTAFVGWCFRQSKIRKRAALSLVDAVLCNRGVFKTTWSVEHDAPVIRSVDPSMLFFDLSVRDSEDIRYWMECTVISIEQFRERVEAGKYKNAGDVTPDTYPKWAVAPDADVNDQKVREATEWVELWEVYDLESKTVTHYVPNGDRVVFEDELLYVPYTVFSLNHNGVDVRGLSEVQLILPQQESINELLTFWNKVVHLTVPRILYDAGMIAEEDLGAAVNAAVGAFVPLHTATDIPGALSESFFTMPTPEMPPQVLEFLSKQESIASFVSALAEAARGQVTGARTATELALIDAQLRTRLSNRVGNLAEALEDLATKCLWLSSKFMQSERQVEISGSSQWVTLTSEALDAADVHFDMVAYNPISSNPAVEAEMFMGLLQVLKESPNFDARAVDEYMVEMNNLPQKLLKPKAQVEAEEKLAAQAQAQADLEEQGIDPMIDPMVATEPPVEASAMKDTAPFSPDVAELAPPPQPPLS